MTNLNDARIQFYTEMLHDGGYFEITSLFGIENLIDEMIGRATERELTEGEYDYEQQHALVAATRWFIECIGGSLDWVRDRL